MTINARTENIQSEAGNPRERYPYRTARRRDVRADTETNDEKQ